MQIAENANCGQIIVESQEIQIQLECNEVYVNGNSEIRGLDNETPLLNSYCWQTLMLLVFREG